jgi:hypothetical protein
MTTPLDYDAHLVITDSNRHLAENLRSVSGYLWIGTPDLCFPMLTQVDGYVYIAAHAEHTSLPVLRQAHAELIILAPGASLPALEWVGAALVLASYAQNTVLPELTSIGGDLDIGRETENISLPVLEEMCGDLRIGREAHNTSLTALKRVGGVLQIYTPTLLPALRTAA